MKLRNKIKEAFAETIAPSSIRCLNCGKDIFDDTSFCKDCGRDVVFNNGKTCPRCGVGIDGGEEYCGNCAFDKVYFDKAYSVFSYEGAVKNVILQMKFGGQGRFAKAFAPYLAFLISEHDVQFDVVCYAPMTKKAKRERGYNQAELLAKYLCAYLGKDDCLTDAIIKTKTTERQEKLSKTERKTNLVGAYALNADVKGKRVLIVDDVKTTGSTLNECAKVLKRGGATYVTGITVASRKEKFLSEGTSGKEKTV